MRACTACYHAGIKRQAKLQYTVRGIPPEVDRVFREKAAQRKQSLNQVILDELTVSAVGRRRRAAFSDLVAQWSPEPDFADILAAQRRIDQSKWK